MSRGASVPYGDGGGECAECPTFHRARARSRGGKPVSRAATQTSLAVGVAFLGILLAPIESDAGQGKLPEQHAGSPVAAEGVEAANAWVNMRTGYRGTGKINTHGHTRISHQVSDRVSRGKYRQTNDRIRESKNKAESLPGLA